MGKFSEGLVKPGSRKPVAFGEIRRGDSSKRVCSSPVDELQPACFPRGRKPHFLKYRGWRAAAPVLGGLLAAYLDTHKLPGETLVPVPLHHRRLRSRGYNQSQLLAKEAGKLLDMPVREGLLKRAKDSPPQVEARTSEQRRANVAGSFVASDEVEGLAILLVDDVATTGSTLMACAAALKDAGAASVWGLVLARDS